MPVFPSSGLSTQIVEALQKGPQSTTALVELCHQATTQGVYKSLRMLQKQGIVLVSKKEAMLNQAWLQQLEKFALLSEHAYRNPISDSGHFLQLKDGDRIKYEFKNPLQVDVFWNHVLYLLFDAIPNLDRWYAYSSHCWFLLAQRPDELALRDAMIGRGIRYLFTVANNTPLDRIVAKDFDGNMSQYYMRPEPLFPSRKNNQGIVLNVLGEYIIEAQYDTETTKSIEDFYQKNTTLTPTNQKELLSIVSLPSHIRFTITRNADKAEKLARFFEKHFYIKK